MSVQYTLERVLRREKNCRERKIGEMRRDLYFRLRVYGFGLGLGLRLGLGLGLGLEFCLFKVFGLNF